MMIATLALACIPAVQDGVYVATMLDGFESLAVEYAQCGAIVRTWLGEQQDLRDLFRINNLVEPKDRTFEPKLILDWPVAWTFFFAGGVSEEAWIAGPNQLDHPEVGRATLDPAFMEAIQSRLSERNGSPLALRVENPLPVAQAPRLAEAVALLDERWESASVEYGGRAVQVRRGLEDLELGRLVHVGGMTTLPDGGGRIVLQGEGERKVILRMLQGSRSASRALRHSWVHVDGAGAFWVSNDWMRALHPDLPSIQLPPGEEMTDELVSLLGEPERIAQELQRLAVETRPLEGEYGPPRLALQKAPLARLPTRVWALLNFERLPWSEARWRRRILDWERLGAARIHLWGKGKALWSMGLIPISDKSALVPFLGRVTFPSEAWSDLARIAASDLGIDDPSSLRMAPR